jgi:hypothetical protein
MSIQTLIEQRVIFGKDYSNGFRMTKCACCNDYQYRGGFKFEGNKIGYNCFNCSTTGIYEDGEVFMSKKFRKILNDFGCSDDDIDTELKGYVLNFKKTSKKQEVQGNTKFEFPKTLDLPEDSFLLSDFPDDYEPKQKALEYLASRKVPLDFPWMMTLTAPYENYILIPYHLRGNTVWWEGRTLDPSAKKRYIGASGDKSKIIFNYDELLRYTTDPLFITEGVFNALSCNGIALGGSKLSQNNINLINHYASKRDKIMVIDKHDAQKNGYKLGCKALELGWKITYIDGSYHDPNDAVKAMGKLWTITNLINNVSEGFGAKIALELIK